MGRRYFFVRICTQVSHGEHKGEDKQVSLGSRCGDGGLSRRRLPGGEERQSAESIGGRSDRRRDNFEAEPARAGPRLADSAPRSAGPADVSERRLVGGARAVLHAGSGDGCRVQEHRVHSDPGRARQRRDDVPAARCAGARAHLLVAGARGRRRERRRVFKAAELCRRGLGHPDRANGCHTERLDHHAHTGVQGSRGQQDGTVRAHHVHAAGQQQHRVLVDCRDVRRG